MQKLNKDHKVLVTIQKSNKTMSVEDDKHRSYNRYMNADDVDTNINNFLYKYCKKINNVAIRFRYV